jgi:4-hydroxy-2-oxoheptanedioate aldolase
MSQPDTRSLARPSLHPLLERGTPAAGVFCELPCAEAVELAGLAGWDFLVLDAEHAPLTAAQLPHLVRASAAAGIPAVIRVAANDPPAIQHALDSGAAGVQIPQVASVQDAARAVRAARFHPTGRRGFNPFVRAADFSNQPVPAFLQHANREVALVLQVESEEGVAAVDGILELPGIDVLFVGPYDLSQSLGIPGQTGHARVFEAAHAIARKAAARGVALGCFTNSLEEARCWIDAGARYLCYSVDTVLLLEALRAAAASIRAACPPR